MALRAVVFDYGMVLTGPQDPAAHAELVRITGLGVEQFEALYWKDRRDYDAGVLTGLSFWQKLVRDGGLNLSDETVDELNRLDVRMWSTVNMRMVRWQETLREFKFKRAILSNMGDSIHTSIVEEHTWINTFDVLVWSYELGIIKPNPAIYEHALNQLGVQAEEALFIDDREENTQAAREVGMQAITFSTAERLREDLVAAGMDAELPLP